MVERAARTEEEQQVANPDHSKQRGSPLVELAFDWLQQPVLKTIARQLDHQRHDGHDAGVVDPEQQKRYLKS